MKTSLLAGLWTALNHGLFTFIRCWVTFSLLSEMSTRFTCCLLSVLTSVFLCLDVEILSEPGPRKESAGSPHYHYPQSCLQQVEIKITCRVSTVLLKIWLRPTAQRKVNKYNLLRTTEYESGHIHSATSEHTAQGPVSYMASGGRLVSWCPRAPLRSVWADLTEETPLA